MSLLVKLTRGGDTMWLSGDLSQFIYGCEYVPTEKDMSADELLSYSASYLDPPDALMVTDPITVLLVGTDSQILTRARTIREWLTYAAIRRKKKMGDRVFIEVRSENSGAYYRAEVFGGRGQLPNRIGLRLVGGVVAIQFTIKRFFCWEASSEVAIPLTNGNGTNTSGLTVKNHDDGGAGDDNYCAIDDADVAGELPAPAILKLKNDYSPSTKMATYFVNHNVFSTPGSFPHILEAEGGTVGGGLTGHSDNAGGSAGFYRTYQWSGSSQLLMNTWPLSSSFLNHAAGNRFKALISAAVPSSESIWLSFRLRYDGNDLWVGPEFYTSYLGIASRSIHDLGSLRLPPVFPNLSGQKALELALYARHPLTGAHSLDVDFIQFGATDSFRKYVASAPGYFGTDFLYGVDGDETLVDDPSNGLYVLDGSGDKAPLFVGYGSPIMLRPGRDQRLHFLWMDVDNTANVDFTMKVQALYRPRRISL